MSNNVIIDTKERMDKSLSFLQQELSGLRTGKANPALVENITVENVGLLMSGIKPSGNDILGTQL